MSIVMKTYNKKLFISILITLLLIMMTIPVAAGQQDPVELGTASSFAVLAGSTITNTGTSEITGDVGLHPGTEFTGQGTATVDGAVYLTDAVALQAKIDLAIAYNDTVGRATDETISADLGGRTLTPGVYTSTSEMAITGTLTLDAQNDPNAVFIFKIGSTLTTASASEVKLINGAQSCLIFWQVGSSQP